MTEEYLGDLLQHYTDTKKFPRLYYHYILYIGEIDYGRNWEEIVFPVLDLVTDDIQESDDWQKIFGDINRRLTYSRCFSDIPFYGILVTTEIQSPRRL